MAAAAGGDCGSGAVRAVREAAAAAVVEAVEETSQGDSATHISSGTRMHLHLSGELTEAYDQGFDALNDASLEEAVLADVLAELRRAGGSSNAGPSACGLLSVPLVSALVSVLCRRCVATHSLPRAFPRFQSELCLLCIHHAISDDVSLARDVLDAAQVFARSAPDTLAAREQLGTSLLAHAVASSQLLWLNQVEIERLVEMAGSSSLIAVDDWVQLYDHMCLELGTNSPRAIDEQEVQAVVMLLRGVAAASLKLRQGVFKRSMELLALSSRPNVREISLRLMVRVVGTQRALVVSKLSELSRNEPTIAMRNTCLSLIRRCFDDASRVANDEEMRLSLSDSSGIATTGTSTNLQQALNNAVACLGITAADDVSPKVRRNALIHAVAIALDVKGDAAGGIKLAASRCFDTAMEVRTEALAQLVHAMERFPEVVAGLRPPIGLQCSMPWHDLVLQLLAHQQANAADAESTAKKKASADEGHNYRAEGEATDEHLRTSETSRQVAHVCEAVLTQPALLGLKETATVDSAICSLRLSRSERQILGSVLGRAILRLSNAQDQRQSVA